MNGYSLVQLIKTVLLGFTALISGGSLILPYWYQFEVQVTWDGGRTMQTKTIDVGLFYMDQGDNINMIDIIMIDKASNAKTFPPMFRVAQIFFGLGISAVFVLFIASLIYFCRKYKSATGEMCLAAGLLPTSLCLVLGTVFAALAGIIKDPSAWEAFPVPDNYMQVKADPVIKLGIGLYVAAFAALLGLVSLGLAWMQACMLCKHVEEVRYQMLNAPLTEDERGVGPATMYKFGAPTSGFRYDGYSKPERGMEVDF
ncbi:uncharacterized protein LOC123539640 [Mercenaria mercenaria]|uniref:uncharacterized protein LOC123539640 n=1 Tax=Mercenaria mercenaria TaxID=6596 RepID=UPI001E1D95BD|nr:uncharacterized protein LOC123539640 [Mercenaria mercenaria]